MKYTGTLYFYTLSRGIFSALVTRIMPEAPSCLLLLMLLILEQSGPSFTAQALLMQGLIQVLSVSEIGQFSDTTFPLPPLKCFCIYPLHSGTILQCCNAVLNSNSYMSICFVSTIISSLRVVSMLHGVQ